MATENNGTFPTPTLSSASSGSPPLLSLPTMISSIPSPLSAFSRPSRNTPPSDPSLLLAGYSTAQLHDLQRRQQQAGIDGFASTQLNNTLLNELANQLLRAGQSPQLAQLPPPGHQAEDVLAKIRQSLLPDKNASGSSSMPPSVAPHDGGQSHHQERLGEAPKQFQQNEPGPIQSTEPVHRIRRRRHSAGARKISGKGIRGTSECSDGGTGLKVPKQEPMPIPPSPANGEVSEHEHQMGTPDDPHPDIHSPPSVRLPHAENGTPNGGSLQSSGNPAEDPANNSGDDDANARQKTCRVCGDTATGYNFNVITCESCKAFFRRNALRPKNDFKCPYSDDCEINAVSRRFCQKCRLKKCFDVGMKKEWILTDEQLRRRKNSRLNNVKNVHSPGTPMGRPKTLFEEEAEHKRKMSQAMAGMPGMLQIKKERISPTDHLPGHDLRNLPPISSGIPNPLPSLNQSAMLSGAAAAAAGLGYGRNPAMPAASGLPQSLISPMIGINSSNLNLPRLGSPQGLNQGLPKPQGLFNSEFEAMRQNLMNASVTASTANDDYEPQILLRLAQQSQALPNQAPPNPLLANVAAPPSQPPPVTSIPTNSEIVVGNNGMPKVALSIDDYQKLIKAASASSSGPPTPGLEQPPAPAINPINPISQMSTPGIDPMVAKHMLQSMLHQQPNLLSGFGNGLGNFGGSPTDINRLIGMANVEVMNAAAINSPYASSSQQMSPGMPLTPDGLRKRYIENIIHDALVESPESSVCSPEAPAPVDREISHYQEIASNYAATNPNNVPVKFHMSPQDWKDLDIVKSAFACMDEPIDTNTKEAQTLKKKDHDPTDIMNIMDIAMKRFVKMAKRLPPFLHMAQESKLALLRSSMIDMLTIRGVTRLDAAHRQWKTPVLGDASISFDMFDKLNDNHQKGRFLHFYRALHDKIRPDPTAINLIALLVLFDCSRANLSSEDDKKTAEKNQTKYYWLLKKYFEHKFGEEAMQILQTVPEALSILRVVSTNAATLFLGRVKTEETEKLVTEFFKIQEQKDKEIAAAAAMASANPAYTASPNTNPATFSATATTPSTAIATMSVDNTAMTAPAGQPSANDNTTANSS